MLQSETSLPLSPYSGIFDLVVPSDHELRKFKELVDFSFVFKELHDKYSAAMGRTAEDPVRMFKYLLLKCMYSLSDRGLMKRALSDMSFKYFLDLAPEAPVIDHSLLSKFRRQRLADMDLLDMLISKSVEIAVGLGIIKSRTLVIDATHTCSKYNPYAPLELLRLRSRKLRRSVYEMTVEPETYKKGFPAKNEDDDLSHEMAYCCDLIASIRKDEGISTIPSVRENLDLLEETVEDIKEHFTVSPDREARVGHKSREDSFLGYKTHIAMTTDRIITAATVTTGEKPDGNELPSLVEKSRKNLGADESDKKVDTVLADGAYSGNGNLELAADGRKGFKLVSRTNPMLRQSNEEKGDGFGLNKDAGMYVCPAGHMAVGKSIIRYNTDKNKGNDRMQFRFDPEKCKVCKFRDTCLKPGAKTRYYSVPIKTPEQKKQLEFEKTEEFRLLSKERYMIEAKNSELKNVFGYDTSLSYGLNSMKLQGAVTIFVSNLKRILRLSDRKG